MFPGETLMYAREVDLPVHIALLVVPQKVVHYLTMLWLMYLNRLFVQILAYPRDDVVAFVVQLNVLL